MRNRWITMTAAGGLVLAAFWQAGASGPEGLEDPLTRESYGMGALIGGHLRGDVIDVDPAAFLEGLGDAMQGRELSLAPEQIVEAVSSYEARRVAAFEEGIRKLASENASAGEAFRTAFAEEEGVTTLASGLQFKVLESGEGKIPGADATVRVHYRGNLIDGTEFDSSYGLDEPARFALAGVIPGFSEALRQMSVGSKWKVVVPPELAYGEQGMGGRIEPNTTLVFELELIEIV